MEFTKEEKEELDKLVKEAKAASKRNRSDTEDGIGASIAHAAEGKVQGLKSALNALTLGAYGGVDRLIGGGAGYLANQVGDAFREEKLPEDEMSFMDFVNRYTENEAKKREEHGMESFFGELAGGLGSGGVGASMAAAGKFGRGAQEALSQPGLAGALKRMLAGAAGGSVQNVTTEAGKKNLTPGDIASESMIGALGGAGGSALGDAIGAGARKIFGWGEKEFGERAAGRALFDEDVMGVGKKGYKSVASGHGRDKPYTLRELDDITKAGRPDQTLGDLSDKFANTTTITAGDTATRGMTGKLHDLSSQRIEAADEQAGQLISKHFPTVFNRAETKEVFDQMLDSARTKYDALLSSRQATHRYPISRSDVATDVRRSFGRAPSGPLKKTMNALIDEANTIGQSTSKSGKVTGGVNNMSPEALLNMKKRIDNMMKPHLGNDDAVSGAAISHLVSLKKKITGRLEAALPGYRDAARSFGDVKNKEELIAAGEKMLRQNSVDSSIFKDYYDGLSDIEKDYFMRGAVNHIRDLGSRNELGTLKKLAGGSSLVREKLAGITDPQRLEEFLSEASQAVTELGNAKKWKAAVEGAEAISPSELSSTNPLGSMVDYVTAIANAVAKGPTSIPAQHSARRVMGAKDEASVQSLMDLLQTTGPDDIMQRARQLFDIRNKSRMPPVAGAVGGAAIGNTLMDQQGYPYQ